MVRVIQTRAYESVLEAIALFPDGAGIEQIEESLSAPPNRRTLQRWLKALIAQKEVHRTGQGRAVKYLRRTVVNAQVNISGQATVTSHAELSIPLSSEAKEVEQSVRRPLGQRTPVGSKATPIPCLKPKD